MSDDCLYILNNVSTIKKSNNKLHIEINSINLNLELELDSNLNLDLKSDLDLDLDFNNANQKIKNYINFFDNTKKVQNNYIVGIYE
jgi:hypothetical protein